MLCNFRLPNCGIPNCQKHPPAGATALLGVTASQGSLWWVVSPVFIGALILLVVALVINNLDKTNTYPDYWY